MRPFVVCLFALGLGVFAGTASGADIKAFEDATLRGVHFVDDQVGWAVGDDGVVWNTLDGGKHWDRQPTGINASLRSVQFLDHSTGWIAGRQELPDGGSAGVVLYTNDGGIKWRQILVNSLPGMHLVRFVDRKTGYLAGEGSDQFPSGVYVTLDSGRSWQPVPGSRASAWYGADFNAEGGALVGAWNRLATVRRGRVHAVAMDSLGGRTLTGVQLRGENGVAVGQGGLVLVSKKSQGSTWDFVKLNLPAEVRDQWDFHAVGGVGSHIWAVGRPGSAVLHSGNDGKSWEVCKTGQSMPLYGVQFRSEKVGYAVGALGTIVVTKDGGASWQVQRRGGQRMAVLCVHARPGGVRLETVGQLGAEDGYLTAGVCVTGPECDSASLTRVSESNRFASAFRQAGGACAESLWQFPIASHLDRADQKALLNTWDRQHGGGAATRMVEQLVLAIRMYRPDVILTDSLRGGPSQHGADTLVAEAVKQAFREAGKEDCGKATQTHLGLEPHSPRKLYVGCETNTGADVTLDLTAVSPRLGMTLREFSASPRGLMGMDPASTVCSYSLEADNLPGARGHRLLMQGIALPSGGFARRELLPVETLSPEELKLVRSRSNLWMLAERENTALTSPDRLLSQVGPTLDAMPAAAGARVAHSLGRQYARAGQWMLAREMFLQLVERYPADPLTVDGYRWLILHQASSEARRRHEMGQFLLVGQTSYGMNGAVVKPTLLPGPKMKNDQAVPDHIKGIPSFSNAVTQESAIISSTNDARRWLEGSLAAEKKLAGFGPLHVRDPAIQFSIQAAKRQLGQFKEATEWYAEFAASQPEGPWRTAALSELWLSRREGPSPRPVFLLRPTESRPHLDGKLDDECWQGVQPVKLQQAVGKTAQYPTEMRMTHDKEFVYIAIRCSHPAGQTTLAATKKARDQDLRRNDRVSIMLDLDRDYATCFHLQIDASGCVAEDCWGDKTWNPRWFAAVHREETAWTAEIAIPRSALTADHFNSGKAWAANVVRVLPGQGVQAFSLPAEAPETAMRLEGLGLILFAQHDARAQSRTPVKTQTQR